MQLTYANLRELTFADFCQRITGVQQLSAKKTKLAAQIPRGTGNFTGLSGNLGLRLVRGGLRRAPYFKQLGPVFPRWRSDPPEKERSERASPDGANMPRCKFAPESLPAGGRLNHFTAGPATWIIERAKLPNPPTRRSIIAKWCYGDPVTKEAACRAIVEDIATLAGTL